MNQTIKKLQEKIDGEYREIAKSILNYERLDDLKNYYEGKNLKNLDYSIEDGIAYAVTDFDIDDITKNTKNIVWESDLYEALKEEIEDYICDQIEPLNPDNFISIYCTTPICYNEDRMDYIFHSYECSETVSVNPSDYDSENNAFRHAIKKMVDGPLKGTFSGLVLSLNNYGHATVDKDMTDYLIELENKQV